MVCQLKDPKISVVETAKAYFDFVVQEGEVAEPRGTDYADPDFEPERVRGSYTMRDLRRR